MKEKDGGQAFPNEGFNGWGEPQQGMTLRDYFAAKALQGLAANSQWLENSQANTGDSVTAIAMAAYEAADAMLTARAK